MTFLRGRAWWSVLALGGASLSLAAHPGSLRQLPVKVSLRTVHGSPGVTNARLSAHRHSAHITTERRPSSEAHRGAPHATVPASAHARTLDHAPTTSSPVTGASGAQVPYTNPPMARVAKTPEPVGSSAPSTEVGPLSTHWIIAASALQDLISAGGGVIAGSTFDNPTTVILGTSPAIDTWDFNRGASAKSLPQMEAVTTATPRAETALYDPEAWPFTPTSEQLDPVGASRTAEGIATSAHMSLIAAPALDLMKVLYPGMAATTAYISKDIPGQLARYVSALEIQAQSLEASPSAYAHFVQTAVSEARAINPSVRIYAGLSTNPDGKTVTAQELYQDVQATSAEVYGYWLNVPSGGSYCPSCGTPQPGIAIDLLSELGN
ncbi:MAG: hypothetical protein M0Z34_08135 [Nitrospiraceae bacterium]|nr:hypothetical protein [Nitrospiraceae bacterium]